MTNTQMLSRTHGKVKRGSVLYTNFRVMNILLISGAKYFATFIDEALSQVGAFHAK